MILVRRLVPPEGRDTEARWSEPYLLNNEEELGPLPDGEWGIWQPTKTTVDLEAANPAPKGWTFDRTVTVETSPPKAKIKG